MGNTQVTPIRPAIPPLINLAGKLDEGDAGKEHEMCKVVDDLENILLQSFVALPDLLVSHLSQAPAGQSSMCLLVCHSGELFSF